MAMPNELERLGLPPIDQVGFVVADMDRSIAHYDALFGPFRVVQTRIEGTSHRGVPSDVELAIALGRSGDLEIELIQWKSGRSPHREFIEAGREGMHHVRFRVDDCAAWIAKLAGVGYELVWHKRFSPEIEFAYLERKDDPLIVELLQMKL
jgi:catechol 2,3-dioxygenase-like lactoylglutathione lyase family enzyme